MDQGHASALVRDAIDGDQALETYAHTAENTSRGLGGGMSKNLHPCIDKRGGNGLSVPRLSFLAVYFDVEVLGGVHRIVVTSLTPALALHAFGGYGEGI